MAFAGFAPPQGITANALSSAAYPLMASDGSASAPSYSFSGETNTGFYRNAAFDVRLSINGTNRYLFGAGSFVINVASATTTGLGFANGTTPDVLLVRDAAATLALKNGTTAQVYNQYGYYASATSFTRVSIKHNVTSVTAAVGATATATSAIPAGVLILGVATTVTTALGNSTGTTGYSVGDGSDADRWGTVVGITAGTDTDYTDYTAAPIPSWSAAAQNITITATGGNFDGTGVIQVDVAYLVLEAD